MSEISTTGFKYLSVHKKLEVELDKNMKKINKEVMKRRHSLFLETESVRQDIQEMTKAAQEIDTIFGPEFTEEMARKMFSSKNGRLDTEEEASKTTSYTLTQARNAMKELKKRKKKDKLLQNKMNHIRRKSIAKHAKRLSKAYEDDDKDLAMMIDSLKNLTVFGRKTEAGNVSLPYVNVSENQSDTGSKQSRFGASKLSSQRWKTLKISRELSLPVISKGRDNHVIKMPTVAGDVDQSQERHPMTDRPKMPARNSFDLSTLPAISLGKQKLEKGELPSKSDRSDGKKDTEHEGKENSGFTISKYLSEVHDNLPKETLLEIERMVKEESFFL